MLCRMLLGFCAFLASILPAFSQVSTAVTWTYSPNPKEACPLAAECEAWQEFRTNHPSPYQAFIVADRGNESVVIISEPPPALSREQLDQALRALFGDGLLQISRFHWPT